MAGLGGSDDEERREGEQSGTEGSLSLTQRTYGKIERGLLGKNEGIPIAIRRLSEEIRIGRGGYTIIIGESSSGKSGYLHENYVIYPYNWYLLNRENTNKKLQIVIWAMERPAENTVGKWMCLYIWRKYGTLIDVNKIFGFNKSRLTEDEIIMVKDCLIYFEKMEEIVTVYEDPINPTGIYKTYMRIAKENGKFKKNASGESIYIPNDPELITILAVDHVGIVKSEKDSDTKMVLKGKDKLDKISEYLRIARDRFGHTPVAAIQLNRGIQESFRRNSKATLKPESSDIEGSSSMYQDCDVCKAIHNPDRYEEEEYFGYTVGEFIDDKGRNRFRTIHVLKNSYGKENLVVGTNFIGEIGYFRDLPASKYMTKEIYREAREVVRDVNWPIDEASEERESNKVSSDKRKTTTKYGQRTFKLAN